MSESPDFAAVIPTLWKTIYAYIRISKEKEVEIRTHTDMTGKIGNDSRAQPNESH